MTTGQVLTGPADTTAHKQSTVEFSWRDRQVMRAPEIRERAERRQEIVEELARRITSGELAQGAPFPTLQELTGRYLITRAMARRVQRSIRDRKLIRRAPGQPYVVGVPDPPPEVPPPSVEEQVFEVTSFLVEQILSGRIRPGERLTSRRRLVREFGVSRWVAWHVLFRLRARGWAVDYHGGRLGTWVPPADQWPPPDTSLEEHPIPDWHVPKSKRTPATQSARGTPHG
ncbi:GntR family transcriptional regulator [Acrocarpospora catenulata]|uniref:GntR family transcriptional regulator n=1 Tax=Acrocarpospora catenulata TaxID=2836182 RepID=UPI001BDAB09E|nr:GntR family transcriptional regulator [Acrocarpospora catenulata]